MSRLLYSFFLILLDAYTRASALWNNKSRAFVTGRQGVFSSLAQQLADNKAPVAWFHCASVGEYEQGLPIMVQYKINYPGHKILVSFFSPSGFESAADHNAVDFKFYLPLDYKSNVSKWLDIIAPVHAFFVKYEFWYNYIKQTKKRNIPIFSVSAIFRGQQPFFKWYGGLNRQMLRNFDDIFVQDLASSELLAGINIPAHITGDTRFDRVLELKSSNKTFPLIEHFLQDKECMIIGSLRDEDVDLITSFINQHKHLKFIVAPHEIVAQKITALEGKLPSSIKYSALAEQIPETQCLIIDNMGMLSTLYRYGKYAYVGGGFSDGIHNLLEPAVYDIPVFFGNQDFERFKEAIDLTDIGAGFPVGSIDEMNKVFFDLEKKPQRYAEIQAAIGAYVDSNKGSARRLMTIITQEV
jgi:3-deoxy-D-manno-octulosonic-acid transferase